MAAVRGELPKVIKWLRKGGHVDALRSWEVEGRSLSQACDARVRPLRIQRRQRLTARWHVQVWGTAQTGAHGRSWHDRAVCD